MNNNKPEPKQNFLIYQPLFEKTFVLYLTDVGASEKTKTNYRTDLRHFLLWMQVTLVGRTSIPAESHIGYLSLVSSDLLANYRNYLLEKNIPVGTINRRLSALRSFIKCCKKNNWINSNAQIEILNVKHTKKNIDPSTETWFDRLAMWEKHLDKQGASKSTIKNYLRDVENFLHWFHEKEKR